MAEISKDIRENPEFKSLISVAADHKAARMKAEQNVEELEKEVAYLQEANDCLTNIITGMRNNRPTIIQQAEQQLQAAHQRRTKSEYLTQQQYRNLRIDRIEQAFHALINQMTNMNNALDALLAEVKRPENEEE